jgi:hypothetical protein
MQTADTLQAQDTATTQAQQQPAQQNTELTALDKARLADTRTTIILDAEQALQELEPFGTEAGQYRDDSPIQGNFWRFRFRGAVVTVSEEFKKAYDAGTILSVSATPTLFERLVPDPMNEGSKKSVITPGWSLTFSDVEKMRTALNAKKLASDLRVSAQVQEKIENLKVNHAMKMITAENIGEYISEDDIKQMLGAV